jgi:LmbE family N-acetylglucosaminyl deacetylase
MHMRDRYLPPGEVTTVRADRVLVIAPHYDDEVLGCGGLLAQLAGAGAEIRVLFLTDSSGGDEIVTDTENYAARRRDEASRALQILGIDDLHHADLPDGRLDRHIDAAAKAIADSLLDFRPDLLLSVSPLELTGDHQAAFAALHRVLSPLRGDSELDGAVKSLRILLYEVNRPGLPNRLVDVSPQIEQLERSIRAYASQLELHNYLDGAIGARRFRTLSLPPDVEAAEGYHEVAADAFTTHSLSGLIRNLGGLPEVHQVSAGPTISVVVRTMDRPELLVEALASLAEGSYRRVEVVLVNDGGQPPAVPDEYPFPVVRVDLPENRGRAAAANAGVDAATGDYVAFLDDDDVAEMEHLATLAGLVEAAGVRVAYTDAAVGVYELAANAGWVRVEHRLPYSRDFDAELLLFDNYIPFNTLLIDRSLLLEAGPFDPELDFFEDWDLLIRLSRLATFHHHRQVTCEYRHFRSAGHQILGERPSEHSDFLAMKARVIDRHRQHQTADVVARVVARLREEAVVRAEESDAHAAEAARLSTAKAELEDAYHRIDGERESLAVYSDKLKKQIQDLHDEEKLLREVADDQENHLKRVYEEIERLKALITEMEFTKAWRLHRTIEKLRGK